MVEATRSNNHGADTVSEEPDDGDESVMDDEGDGEQQFENTGDGNLPRPLNTTGPRIFVPALPNLSTSQVNAMFHTKYDEAYLIWLEAVPIMRQIAKAQDKNRLAEEQEIVERRKGHVAALASILQTTNDAELKFDVEALGRKDNFAHACQEMYAQTLKLQYLTDTVTDAMPEGTDLEKLEACCELLAAVETAREVTKIRDGVASTLHSFFLRNSRMSDELRATSPGDGQAVAADSVS